MKTKGMVTLLLGDYVGQELTRDHVEYLAEEITREETTTRCGHLAKYEHGDYTFHLTCALDPGHEGAHWCGMPGMWWREGETTEHHTSTT